MTKEELEKEQEKDYKEFWEPLLLTDGVLDPVKVKNEMMDLIFVYKQVGKVYCEITGGLLSKPMYYADIIISAHNDEIQKSYDQGFEDGVAESK